jgi:hypothetical protein
MATKKRTWLEDNFKPNGSKAKSPAKKTPATSAPKNPFAGKSDAEIKSAYIKMSLKEKKAYGMAMAKASQANKLRIRKAAAAAKASSKPPARPPSRPPASNSNSNSSNSQRNTGTGSDGTFGSGTYGKGRPSDSKTKPLPRTTSKNPKPSYKDFPNSEAGYRAYDRALAKWSRSQQSTTQSRTRRGQGARRNRR